MKKRKRVISDSDPEVSPQANKNSEKPKKAKKTKKTSKSKTSDSVGEGKKKVKPKQIDDDVFTSDNGEQGLNLLAKYSVEASSVPQDGKVSPKKRKRSVASEDASGI